MSERITDQWTNTLEEAFGDTPAVRKGRIGEMLVMNAIKSWGWKVIDYENNRNKQIIGADIGFKNPKWSNYYTGSIKNNMLADGSFRVYDEWIHKTKTDRVFHCNDKTGWICWYGTSEMKSYYRENLQRTELDGKGKRFLTVKINDETSFDIGRARYRR